MTMRTCPNDGRVTHQKTHVDFILKIIYYILRRHSLESFRALLVKAAFALADFVHEHMSVLISRETREEDSINRRERRTTCGENELNLSIRVVAIHHMTHTYYTCASS